VPACRFMSLPTLDLRRRGWARWTSASRQGTSFSYHFLCIDLSLIVSSKFQVTWVRIRAKSQLLIQELLINSRRPLRRNAELPLGFRQTTELKVAAVLRLTNVSGSSQPA
jgi:hypothetical protein